MKQISTLIFAFIILSVSAYGLAETCSNGLWDANETGLDCGGNCTACSLGVTCAVNGDCASGLCNVELSSFKVVLPRQTFVFPLCLLPGNDSHAFEWRKCEEYAVLKVVDIEAEPRILKLQELKTGAYAEWPTNGRSGQFTYGGQNQTFTIFSNDSNITFFQDRFSLFGFSFDAVMANTSLSRFGFCADPSLPQCGDSYVQSTEACDDGNLLALDGCDASCEIEVAPSVCGNERIEVGESCDDGNDAPGDGCSEVCVIEIPPEFCGDGEINHDQIESRNGTFTAGQQANITLLGEHVDIRVIGVNTQSSTPTATISVNGETESVQEGVLKVLGGIEVMVLDVQAYTQPVGGGGALLQLTHRIFEQCDDGNIENDDGCSSQCILEEVVPPTPIPEFSSIAAGIAMIGAGALYLARRRY